MQKILAARRPVLRAAPVRFAQGDCIYPPDLSLAGTGIRDATALLLRVECYLKKSWLRLIRNTFNALYIQD
ncbi:hypothetical protein [Comamonas composti]|uniref:hypothetical protein n=1 Tax=Comamonas composti TaxID=408558 RepID=UPI00047C24BE|nr:hypothetical protein [Comamonas composti]